MTYWGMPSSGGLRARVRAELVREIKDEARRQLAQEGASSLSLRAIARHLDMVSSGIYRYFKSRDELLTALIVDAYEAIGSAVEKADERCERCDFTGRWSACCHAVRDWALEHPHEYALIYGSPVPGYHAPEETTSPASRVALALVTIIHDAAGAGELRSPFVADMSSRLTMSAAAEATRLKAIGFDGVPDDAVIRSLAAWTQLFGSINFEVFGRLADFVEDTEAVFDQSVRDMTVFVGLVGREPSAVREPTKTA
jgi:AcrR family transcriptional regulator